MQVSNIPKDEKCKRHIEKEMVRSLLRLGNGISDVLLNDGDIDSVRYEESEMHLVVEALARIGPTLSTLCINADWPSS